MKVLVTGASGFLGSHTVQRLLAHGYDVRCMVRPTSNCAHLPADQVEWAVGNIDEPETVREAAHGTDAVVNIINLLSGNMTDTVRAFREADVRRVIFIGSAAIWTSLNVPSKQKRQTAEAVIAASGLNYTILRPTMIYGTARDRNMSRLIRYLQRYPMIPVFGTGEYLQQPVYVDDVAMGIVNSLGSPASVYRSYDLPGRDMLTYNDVIDTIVQMMGKSIFKVHLPARLIIAGMEMTEKLHVRLPVKSEQVKRLNEDKVCAYEQAARDFDYQPRTFADGIRHEMIGMGINPTPIPERPVRVPVMQDDTAHANRL